MHIFSERPRIFHSAIIAARGEQGEIDAIGEVAKVGISRTGPRNRPEKQRDREGQTTIGEIAPIV
ncbi:hypothetical protein GCM10009020_33210 [Natronoarchaeum mannanilyticum]|uniref:Uncharacterized protein n=1 Tax=Natronoarchaeum mannanilyticum TaxID=926360 RepID=A0AAV3TDT7_9EURY